MGQLQRLQAAPPVRHVHLGLGSFFRAHQAWYTAHAPDAAEWGIAAFAGRSTQPSGAFAALKAQGGLYTLVTRNPEGDCFEVVSSIARVHLADDHAGWLGYLKDPQVQLITTTVTEAGYVRGTDGGLDVDRPEVRSDLDILRADLTAPVTTAPAKLVAGFAAVEPALVDAARLLGANPARRVLSLLVPLARRSLLAAAVLSFLHTMGEFGVVLMLGGDIPGATRTLSIVLYNQVENFDYAAANRTAAILLGLSVVALAAIYLGGRPRGGRRA